MAPMVFADEDIILKLAEYDLLDETCALAQVTPSEVRVRFATPRVLWGKRRKLITGPDPGHTDAGFDRAIAFAEMLTRLLTVRQMNTTMRSGRSKALIRGKPCSSQLRSL